MIFNSNYDAGIEGKELAYDLRQGLANVLIQTLGNIKIYREERDYKNWFEELDGLFIDISFKLTNEEIEKYNKFMMKLNKLIKEEPEVYLNKDLEGEKIYIKLKEINMWILGKMEKYKMFGAKPEKEGLI